MGVLRLLVFMSSTARVEGFIPRSDGFYMRYVLTAWLQALLLGRELEVGRSCKC